MRTAYRSAAPLICALALLACSCGGSGERTFGRVSSVTGTAEVFRTGGGKWRPLASGAAVLWGDSVRTAGESDVEIAFGENTVKLGEKTTICVRDSVDSAGVTAMTVFNAGGEVLSDIKNLAGSNRRYQVETPTAVAAVRGTHFLVAFTPGVVITNVRVLGGKVWVHNPLMLVPPVVLLPGFFTAVAFRAHPRGPMPIPYGQFKKMERMLGPKHFKAYSSKFKIKPGMHPYDPIVPGHGNRMMRGGPRSKSMKGGPRGRMLPRGGGKSPFVRRAAPKQGDGGGTKGGVAEPARQGGKGGSPQKGGKSEGGKGKK